MEKGIAIVTGVSHEKGIGAATCKRLAQAGNDIFFTHWQADKNWEEQFNKEIRQYGVRSNGASIDLANPDAAKEVLDTVEEALGFPSILVNNAAYSTNDGYKLLDAQTLDAHYAVNIRSVSLLCVEFARRFEEKEMQAGRIINLTSGQAQGPMVNELAYVATKGAISALTLALSAEIGELGITVNAVNPGPTDTGWMSEKLKQELAPKFSTKRIGMPDDAARLIAFLASEEAEWITGQVINSEGGFFRN
ncbi:SDR family oxidoreductase [Oceanobacillus manasiensis]|uniref:SDR family oxidoreductase n=1 Tax=Oceanobacillus manasiensis TaxID=586413 RepID=UPI0005AAEF3A|nr:SDR family oxidoreductase [Oceanobacillus manasiensis]